ncbi:capping protein regulator and myosin 1 linker 1 leucine rich repeat protein isoform X2 [Rhodnius prolixus]|uniref:capping protein regulator and myosin 1 linker 1 leucine rich repeat protein isoform X2 n=1 Tax=Rhodnius prolixus TaxID=13249 RepID=UPI003D18D0D4
MSTRSQLTKDLNESVTTLLGKRIKILLKNVVKLESKGDKTENRVLVFSPCRLFLLTAKVPTRIDCHFHYLEIKGIETRKDNALSFLIGEKWYTFLCQSGEVESMLHALCAALQVIFPGVPLQQIVDRMSVDGFEQIMTTPSTQPACGAFSTQYACMCDFHGLPYRAEVAWDVDTIYVSHNTRELSLKDFDHLEPKDMVPIISALEHNRWFTGFRAANSKLTHEAVDRILHVISRSVTLEVISLCNLSLKSDFVNRLCSAVQVNANIQLNSIDLSNNPLIEDKGVNSLCSILTKLVQEGKGISHLNLSHTGLTAKGIGQLAQCMVTLRPQSLTYLNLSGCVIREEINGLCSLLAEPNAITHLDISNTDIILDTVFGALLRGCSTSLVHLNCSRNSFCVKKCKEMPPSFKQFFTSTLSLKYLDMSHCKLPMEALKNLLLGLACNESTVGLELDLSCNCLGSLGAHVLESCIHGVRAISSLDISDNAIETELGGVVQAVGRNKSIVELKICKNLLGMKPKHIAPVTDAIIHTIQEDDCVLETLSVADCRLKNEIHTLINALGSNQCLRSLDISGNNMGELGARLLAKALQTNCKLRSLVFDRNNITLQGYSDIAYAMNSNFSLVYMGCLVHDVLPCMKISPDKTEQVLGTINKALFRNSTPGGNTKVLRRQHGVLVNCSQQTLERAITQTQETIKTLSQTNNDHTSAVNAATALIEDADNAKQVFGRLQDIAEGGDITASVTQKLTAVSQDIALILHKHLHNRVDEMLNCAEELCGTRVVSEKIKSELKTSVAPKISVDPEFLNSSVVTRPTSEITVKASEMGLMAATHLADKITDEVTDLLNKTQTSLLGGKRSSTPDVLRTMPRQTPDPLHPMATPQLVNKRKSVHGRRLRPNSVVDTYSAEHIPDLLPSISTSPQDSLDSVCEGAGQRLQHLVKGRPKRIKTRAPTRPNHNPPILADSEDFDSTDNQSTTSELSNSLAKPRPWSAICDKSEIGSETSTAANTPDSADSPSLMSADGDKRSVRDIAASLNKQVAGDSEAKLAT